MAGVLPGFREVLDAEVAWRLRVENERRTNGGASASRHL